MHRSASSRASPESARPAMQLPSQVEAGLNITEDKTSRVAFTVTPSPADSVTGGRRMEATPSWLPPRQTDKLRTTKAFVSVAGRNTKSCRAEYHPMGAIVPTTCCKYEPDDLAMRRGRQTQDGLSICCELQHTCGCESRPQLPFQAILKGCDSRNQAILMKSTVPGGCAVNVRKP